MSKKSKLHTSSEVCNPDSTRAKRIITPAKMTKSKKGKGVIIIFDIFKLYDFSLYLEPSCEETIQTSKKKEKGMILYSALATCHPLFNAVKITSDELTPEDIASDGMLSDISGSQTPGNLNLIS